MSRKSIFNIHDSRDFEFHALDIFRYQAVNNPVYAEFLRYMNIAPESIKSLSEIPFLPIQFFKSHKVLTRSDHVDVIFKSSGTTGSVRSTHFVSDLSLYKASFFNGFKEFYGNIDEWIVLALLPSYLERNDSSLVYMVNELIKATRNKESGFYLDNLDALAKRLAQLESQGKKTLLLGVSFGLLDLLDKYSFNLKSTVVMETGGMKGQRKELIKPALHSLLCNGFGLSNIHSEYGMTELLSQAYSSGNGIFKCPPWMKILIRDTEDAMNLLAPGRSGGINVIDLANRHSCSFIATQDLGRLHPNGTFEVLGRFDTADIRGCNLMVH